MLSFGAVNLWKLEKADLGHHYRWANNDTLRRLVGGPPRPRNFQDLEAWHQTVQQDPKQEIYSVKSWDAQVLGWLQLFSLDPICGSVEVGVVVDEEHWGRGIGHDALVAAVKYAFEDLRLHRVGAEILAVNLPSKRLFEGLGFRLEGTRREAFFTSGRYLDVECYGLLSREFVLPRPKTVKPEQSTE